MVYVFRMTTNDKDRRGERIGTFTVVAEAGWHPMAGGKRVRRWRFRCGCGHEIVSPFHSVASTRGKPRECPKCRPSKVEDMSLWRHGKLRVKSFHGMRGDHAHWNVECVECGQTRRVMGASLKKRITPCFCVQNAATHGMSKSKTYTIWNAMIRRCTNPNDISFPNYGARGISVCARWMRFENFLSDMGEVPDKLMLDRIDNSKGYGPDNCKWVTRTEQNRNTRRNIRITWNGETKTLPEWADALGWSRQMLNNRYFNNWTVERMLTTPPRPAPKRKP